MRSTAWPTYSILLLGVAILTSPLWITEIVPRGFYILFWLPIATFVGGAYIATSLSYLTDEFSDGWSDSQLVIILYLTIVAASNLAIGTQLDTILNTIFLPMFLVLSFYFIGYYSNRRSVQTGFIFGLALYLISGLVFFIGSSSIVMTGLLLLLLTVFGAPLFVYGLSIAN